MHQCLSSAAQRTLKLSRNDIIHVYQYLLPRWDFWSVGINTTLRTHEPNMIGHKLNKLPLCCIGVAISLVCKHVPGAGAGATGAPTCVPCNLNSIHRVEMLMIILRRTGRKYYYHTPCHPFMVRPQHVFQSLCTIKRPKRKLNDSLISKIQQKLVLQRAAWSRLCNVLYELSYFYILIFRVI